MIYYQYGQHEKRLVEITMNLGIFTLIAAAAIALSVRKYLSIKREKGNLWDLRMATCMAGVISIVLVISLMVVNNHEGKKAHFSETLGLLFLLSVIMVVLMWILLGKLQKSKHKGKTWQVIKNESNDKISRAIDLGRSLPNAVAPNGWKEIKEPNQDLTNGELSFRRFFKAYSWILLAFVPFMVVSMWVLNDQSNDFSSEVFAYSVQYNLLIITSIVTTASMIFLAVVFFLDKVDVINFSVKYVMAMRKVASWVGAGTLAGAVAASLYPVVYILVNTDSDKSFRSGNANYFVVSPDILVSGPAGGAVVGYIIGLVAMTFALGSEASNMAYRCLLIPSIYALTLLLLRAKFYDPRSMWYSMQSLSEEEIRDSDNICTQTGTVGSYIYDADYFSNSENIFRYCGGETIVSGNTLYLSIVAVIVLVALYCFFSGVRQNVKYGDILNSSR